MPSKLRKALGAVKDQTSISLAKVTNAANLEVTILRATTHDEIPMEERYVTEILQVVSSHKGYAAICAQSIGKRIGKTKNWVVALKSLMLVLRIFQDGDPYFPREVFHQMKNGAKILNLSGFKDDSNSSPWDYTAFVRTFALYLDERLDCFLTGKLQRRFTYFNQTRDRHHHRDNRSLERGIKDMKPTMLLDRISYWQRLLDRAIGTRPTGSARTNRLVQIALYAILQESFDLYKDISDGLAVLLDSFFQMPYHASVKAFQACVKSSKQFDDLTSFYTLCACIGIGRTSEYPSVQKVSEELLETLQEFLKDQASFPASNNGYSPFSKQFIFPNPRDPSSSYGTPEMFFEIGSQCTSLEDLMSATDSGLSPGRSLESDSEQSDQDEKQSQNEDYASANDSESSQSNPNEQTYRSSFELLRLDDFLQEEQKVSTSDSKNGRDCWELVLAATATKPEPILPMLANGSDPLIDTFFDQCSIPQHQYNPFLDDEAATVAPPSTSSNLNFSTADNLALFIDLFDTAPTSQAAAADLFAQNHSEVTQKSIEPTMAPTFKAQSCDFDTDLALVFGDINQNGIADTPTFNAHSYAETIMAPTFHAHNRNGLTASHSAPTFLAQSSVAHDSSPAFPAHNFNGMSMAPTFKDHAPAENGWAPTFQAHKPNQMNTALTFSIENVNMTMAEPTFRAQNHHRSMTEPTFAAQNLDEIWASPPFHMQNFDDRNIAAPTFSARDSNHKTMATPFGDDLFGPWPGGAMADQHSSMKQQDVLLQQKLWLEQQNKIIAKRMT
ncbi:hypothetical protein L6164_029092 [Bauhinia variegata]|uniref:Uncharacterized protein n=1 Tax=Bauhinia variegata TaxID=167791 RepID=A0ACB9L8M4_BAUVA|nr:hypothetical protein L6164_029092 [Bauhinia variegata]